MSVNLHRPSFEEVFIDMAVTLSKRSSCKRAKVGTIISSTDFRQIISIGYNGNATGLENCCDRDVRGNCGCIHAEENAVINCISPRNIEKVVFVTMLPCEMCAKRLINLGGVKSIIYLNDYFNSNSIELFKTAGILVKKITPNS